MPARITMLVTVGALAGLVAAPAAYASFHLTKVSEVATSRDGSATEQFVELQDPAEPYPDSDGPYKLIVYDGAGLNPHSVSLPAATLRTVAATRPILISSAAYDSSTAMTHADIPLTVTLPAVGQACFTAGASDTRIHCMAWGTPITNPLTGSGGAIAGPAPANGQSLQTQCDGTAAVGTPTPGAANAALTPFCADQAPTAHFTFAPTAPAVGQAVTFDGSTSTDPDASDHVASWHWLFDGTPVTTTGPTTTFAFTSAGAHTVTLTVLDTLSKASTAAVSTVTVSSPGGGGGGGGGGPSPTPSSFAGVTLRATKVSVGANGIAALRVACPASTTGSCAGRLTLKDGKTKVASKAFTAAAGKTATVKLKLSASERRKLRKRGRLKLSLTIAAHDGSGLAAKTRTVKVTLTRR